MKYPNVIFFRRDKYSYIDENLNENKENLNCTLFITNNVNDLNNLFDPNYHLLITFGDTDREYFADVFSIIAPRMARRWIHYVSIPEISTFNSSVNYCYIHNVIEDRDITRCIFSIFTTCYNTFEKINRVYDSVKSQTLKDWEWVILDDSPDDKNFLFLKEKFKGDKRIRLYKRSDNSGSIGNVKNEAVSLCRGKYVLELDHDDEILPDVLNDATNVFEKNPDVGFVYMDFINIYENGASFSYGDFICKGYGGYYCQKYKGKWVNVYNTPNINNITLSHLVCLPNHPRIWRRKTLLEIGNYSEFLPICDDYEVLLNTAMKTKIAKIPKLGYVQYMNDNNNNFSLIRNSEINRIGPFHIMPQYYNTYNVNEKMKELGAYEHEEYIYKHSKLWDRPEDYEHKYCNKLINVDYDFQYCIIGVDTLYFNKEKILELTKKQTNDFIVIDNKHDIKYISEVLDLMNFSFMKCYSMQTATDEQLVLFFERIYKSCDNYQIIKKDNAIGSHNPTKANSKLFPHNTDHAHRHQIINANTDPTNTYLEIGVEYGGTFKNAHFENKIAVDPDPKFEDDRLLIMTSDEFFNDPTKETLTFDVFFLDGMHQSEFIMRDINNALNKLNLNGKIFIDDILPISYNEQLKVPNKHYYEKGILKYGEPWTGDVWKVLYYILQNFNENFDFSYYNHVNYRGVGLFSKITHFQIPEEAIEEINGYDYHIDFEKYISLIEIITKK
jgi:glycosyltransferase involved in cell wall biosynthesis